MNGKRKKLEFDLQFLPPKQVLENILKRAKYQSDGNFYEGYIENYCWLEIISKHSARKFKRRISKATGVRFKWDKLTMKYTTEEISNGYKLDIRLQDRLYDRLKLGLINTNFVPKKANYAKIGPAIYCTKAGIPTNLYPGELVLKTDTNEVFVADSNGNLTKLNIQP